MTITIYNTTTLTLPDEFESIPKELHSNYVSGSNVDYVYSLEEKKVTICITKTDRDLSDEQVTERIQAHHQLYSRMAPGFEFGQLLQKNLSGQEVAILTYKANAPTRDLYHIMAVTPLDGKELQLFFICDLQDAPKYMSVFLKVLESIHVNKE